ncbi:hypothetical protein V1523DRAFT_420382 [Lipomyces doorenjongii]
MRSNKSILVGFRRPLTPVAPYPVSTDERTSPVPLFFSTAWPIATAKNSIRTRVDDLSVGSFKRPQRARRLDYRLINDGSDEEARKTEG